MIVIQITGATGERCYWYR